MTKSDLDQYFSKYGKLKSSKIIYDYKTKRSKGLALIRYVELNDAQKLLQLPESEFSVMKPTPSRCRRLKKGAFNQDEAEDCYFNRLPDELINHIFSFFDIEERIRLEIVCKRWRYVNTTVSWGNMHELNLDNIRGRAPPEKILMEILKRCGSTLCKIDFSSCCSRTLTKQFPKRYATKFANYCLNLETVNFFGATMNLSSWKIFSEQCKNLKSVSLENCHLVDEQSVCCLLKNSNLHHLDLSWNRKITGECFRFIKDSVNTLILNGCVKLSPVYFKFLENKVGICDLRLSRCTRLTLESLITVISSLERSLVELHLGGYFGLCDESDYVELFSHCKNLERLNLEDNIDITDNIVSVISENCPLLCSINLRGTLISNACLISLKKISNVHLPSRVGVARIYVPWSGFVTWRPKRKFSRLKGKNPYQKFCHPKLSYKF